MQFLQINLAKMRGTRVVRVGGEPFVAVPMSSCFAHSRDAIYANFIMNETTSYGHTFVVSERRRQGDERMPIIGNVSPYVPMAKEDAEMIPDEQFSQEYRVNPDTGEIMSAQYPQGIEQPSQSDSQSAAADKPLPFSVKPPKKVSL